MSDKQSRHDWQTLLPHQDDYGHLFYFLSGEGLVWVQDKEFKASPGLVVRVNAGEVHAYENTGDEDLMLISVNIPTRDMR
jgi:mannose-6-phosphate isomerase-like protein (cupin superfamily)